MQSIRTNVWQKMMAGLLVTLLLASNMVTLGTSLVSYAVENLENQNEKTQSAKVEFGAYFESEGQKVHSLISRVTENPKMYLHLNVKEAGYLKNARIALNDTNYQISQELATSEIIAGVSENSLTLKQISFGTDAILEIPMTLAIGNSFAISNISKESKVTLTGTYVGQDGKEVAIQKEVTLHLIWESLQEITAESTIKTYKAYEQDEENGIILQEEIKVKKVGNHLPVKKTTLDITAPTYQGELPTAVRVSSTATKMTNGKTENDVLLSVDYNQQTGKATVVVENPEVNGIVFAGTDGEDIYTVTYEYRAAKVESATIAQNHTITVENYSYGETGRKTVSTIQNEETLTAEMGSIVSGTVVLPDAIQKAKLYANTNSNRREYETEYFVKEMIQIAKAGLVENIVVEEKEENFVTANGNKKSASVYGVDYTYYKATKVAKTNFENILGESGSIVIKNEQGTVVATINASSEEKDGVYHVNYSGEDNITIETSAPVAEGDLILEHTKAIKADLAYSKADLTAFQTMETAVLVNEEGVTGTANFAEPVANITLQSNKQEIDQAEETIELRVDLGNNQENATLYENPIIKITLPDFVEDVTINNTNLLFEDELQLNRTYVETNSNGEKVIVAKLTGIQTKFSNLQKGATLVVEALLQNKEEAGEKEIKVDVEGNVTSIPFASYRTAPQEKEAQRTVATLTTAVPSNVEGTTVPRATLGTENTTDPTEETKTAIEETQRMKLTLEGPEEESIEEEEPIIYIINIQNDYSHAKQETDEDAEPQETSAEDLRIIIKKAISHVQANTFANVNVDTMEREELEELLSDVIAQLEEEGTWETVENEVMVMEPEEIILKSVTVKDFLPAGVTYKNASMEIYNMETEAYEEVEGKTTYDAQNRSVTWQVGNMPKEKPMARLILAVEADKLEEGTYTKTITNTVSANYQGYTGNVTSNSVSVTVTKPGLSMTKQTENVKDSNEIGDQVSIILKGKNEGGLATEGFKITGQLPNEFIPQTITWGKVGEEKTLQTVPRTLNIKITSLEPQEEFILKVTGLLDMDANYKEEYQDLPITVTAAGDDITWNVRIHNPDYIEPEEPEKPDTPTEPEQPVKTYNISGLAWMDENKNGIKEEKETLLKDIEVKLLKGTTQVASTKTDKNGTYRFEEVASGEYQIVFFFDGAVYQATTYRKTGEKEINSSAIAGEKGQALTDVIEVNQDVQHMNIGLIKIPEFDFRLTKTISKIVVQSREGTKTYEFGSDMAKVDINARYIKGAVVLVEYKIAVKNEGELAGRVKKIIDYMPKDMTFSTDLNRTWVQDTKGNLVNNELKDLTIEPGETKEITLVLKKTMTEDNVGLINNTAEIAEIENTEKIKDKDSTAGNRVNGEDDMSSANVLIGIRTGSEVLYVTLALVILMILFTGTYLIKKKVLTV